MSNPLLNSQPKQNNYTNKLSQIISMVKMAKNPQAIIQNNPQLKSLLSLYNGDAKTAFYSLCKQKGIDPESILSQLK